MYICVHTHIYDTHSGILLSHKSEILPFMKAWMDLKGFMLNEMSGRESQVLYHMIFLICGISRPI